MITIRDARVSDAQMLTTFINGAYRGTSSKSGWTTEADLLEGTRTHEELITRVINTPGSRIILYMEDRQINGCMELRLEGKQMYLGMLTVHPEKQGAGIGKQLLKLAEEEADNNNCDFIYMTVITRRTELIDWYVRHGYYDTGELRPQVRSAKGTTGIYSLKKKYSYIKKAPFGAFFIYLTNGTHHAFHEIIQRFFLRLPCIHFLTYFQSTIKI